uniref:Rapid ALkalinization Factor n=1 Tax=Davidia involucrata TaxID=16924 RepID=A0A5B6YZL6_DAVIN
MAFSSLHAPLFLSMLVIIYVSCCNFCSVKAHQIDSYTSLQLMNEALEWPYTMSIPNDEDLELEEIESTGGGGGVDHRRSLYWSTTARQYYISYGALSANRIPCPPRSGRSYYTHNCYTATGPVHPYTRGCSTITRCRR